MPKKKAASKASPQSDGGITPPSKIQSMKRFATGFFTGDRPRVVKIFVIIVILMALVAAANAVFGKV